VSCRSFVNIVATIQSCRYLPSAFFTTTPLNCFYYNDNHVLICLRSKEL
jgi:hypothetical protein